MNNEKKVVYNVLPNIVVQVLLVVSGLIIPRLILLKFGSNMNGLINSISQFLAYVGLVELGVGNAAIVILYKPIAEMDLVSISSIISIVRKKYIFAGIIYTSVICMLAIIYPFFIRTEFDFVFVFSMVIIIGLTSIIDFFIIGKYKVLLYADSKYYIINFPKIVATIFLTIGSSILLLNNRSVFCIKVLAVITHLGEAIFIKFYVRKQYPDINFHVIIPGKVIPQQINTLIHQLTAVITYNTDLVVLTLLGTDEKLKEISVYSVYAMAFAAINNLIGCFATGFDSIFGNMIAQNEEIKLRKLFEIYEYCYLLILYALYTSFAVLVVPFVKCYTQGVSDVNYIRLEVGILFAANGIVAELKNPHGCIVKAYGKYKQTQKYIIAEACANIMISIILVKPYGVTGVLIGTFISHVIADVGLIAYADRFLLKQTSWQSVKHNVINLGIAFFLVITELKIVKKIYDWKLWTIYAFVIFSINIILIGVVNALTDMKSFRDSTRIIKYKITKMLFNT